MLNYCQIMNWDAYLLSNEYTYFQTKQNHIDVIKGNVKYLVQDYLSIQARKRLDRLLTDNSQYYKQSAKWKYVFNFIYPEGEFYHNIRQYSVCFSIFPLNFG